MRMVVIVVVQDKMQTTKGLGVTLKLGFWLNGLNITGIIWNDAAADSETQIVPVNGKHRAEKGNQMTPNESRCKCQRRCSWQENWHHL